MSKEKVRTYFIYCFEERQPRAEKKPRHYVGITAKHRQRFKSIGKQG